MELDTLFLCMMHFFHTGRKLFLTSSVDNISLCAETKGCSGCIHSNVTATDNSNFLALMNRCIIIISEGFHQVVSCQELIGRENAVCLLTRDTHELRKAGT